MCCPTCSHTMQSVASFVFWCPRCGTLKMFGEFERPRLVDRCLQFESNTLVDYTLEWNAIGIKEAIHTEEKREQATTGRIA